MGIKLDAMGTIDRYTPYERAVDEARREAYECFDKPKPNKRHSWFWGDLYYCPLCGEELKVRVFTKQFLGEFEKRTYVCEWGCKNYRYVELKGLFRY